MDNLREIFHLKSKIKKEQLRLEEFRENEGKRIHTEISELRNRKIELEGEILKLTRHYRDTQLFIQEVQRDFDYHLELEKKRLVEEFSKTNVVNLSNEVKSLREEKESLKSEISKLRNRTTLSKTLEKIDNMDGTRFEKFCEEILKDLGYRGLRLTPTTGDYGIDVLCKIGNTSYGFQCKNYKSVVGNKAVQEALGGKSYYKVDRVVVITNNYFTANAKSQAARGNVELWDRDVLIELINDSLFNI